jgi:RNA polymerase sigma-70 factor (ECF subfamily)
MSGEADLRTSSTLLGRLRDPADAAAWPEFVDRYGPRIYGWCQKWRLQEADAQDVTQEVLIKLVQLLRTFPYDRKRSFRGWLYTVTHNLLCDMAKDRKRAGRGTGGGGADAALADIEAREDLVRHLEEEFDRELLQLAMQRVQLRVKPDTWRAFYLFAVEGLSSDGVARQLGLKVGTVIVYHGRVKQMLRQEIDKLEECDPA